MKIEKVFIGVNKELETSMLIADLGKVLRRKRDGWIAGMSTVLGYVSRLTNGEEFPVPHLETPDEYEEIEKEVEE